jgi:methionine-rich copper-binding protein CopC
MKGLASFVFTVVVVVAVLVGFIAFAHHNGPGDSPRDDNNTKTAPAAFALPGGAGTSARA